jgi:hypothetical protein
MGENESLIHPLATPSSESSDFLLLALASQVCPARSLGGINGADAAELTVLAFSIPNSMHHVGGSFSV